MKKILLSIIFLNVFQFSQAQDNKWELGIEAGPNASTIEGMTLPIVANIGFSSGLTARYNFTAKFSVKTGLGFEIKGFDYNYLLIDSQNRTASFNNRYLYDYLVLPILARFDFGNEDKLRFFVNAGPYFGYLLNNVTELSSKDFNGASQSSTTYGVQATKPFDMGISLGFGLSKNISDKIIAELELRGNDGFINVSDEPLYTTDQIKGLYTESLNLLIGLRYRL